MKIPYNNDCWGWSFIEVVLYIVLITITGTILLRSWHKYLQHYHVDNVCRSLVGYAQVTRQWAMLHRQNKVLCFIIDKKHINQALFYITRPGSHSHEKSFRLTTFGLHIKWRGGWHSRCLQFTAHAHSAGTQGSYLVQSPSYGYQCRVIIAASGRVRVQYS